MQAWHLSRALRPQTQAHLLNGPQLGNPSRGHAEDKLLHFPRSLPNTCATSCSTERQVFLFNKKICLHVEKRRHVVSSDEKTCLVVQQEACLLVQQEYVLLLNTKTHPLFQKEDMSSCSARRRIFLPVWTPNE